MLQQLHVKMHPQVVPFKQNEMHNRIHQIDSSVGIYLYNKFCCKDRCEHAHVSKGPRCMHVPYGTKSFVTGVKV